MYFKNGWCELYKGDCLEEMSKLPAGSVDLVMTSPPYNTARNLNSLSARKTHNARYDVYVDDRPVEEYVNWTVGLFNEFDRLLKKDRVVLYNFSWCTDYTNIDDSELDLWIKTLNGIVVDTPFHLNDMFCWKKGSALPNNVSVNGATRIWEPVMVFCRKSERMTFHANKTVKSQSKTGQNYYSLFYNFIDAPNNDGSCDLNKATYSSDLCYKMFQCYGIKDGVVLDPFNGTGTTGVACKQFGCRYVGIELSEEQLKYSVERFNQPVQQFLGLV